MEGKCQPQSRHPSVPSLCPGPQETPPPPRCPRSEEACLSPHSGRDTGGVGPQGEPPRRPLLGQAADRASARLFRMSHLSAVSPAITWGGPLFLWFMEFFHRVLSGPSPTQDPLRISLRPVSAWLRAIFLSSPVPHFQGFGHCVVSWESLLGSVIFLPRECRMGPRKRVDSGLVLSPPLWGGVCRPLHLGRVAFLGYRETPDHSPHTSRATPPFCRAEFPAGAPGLPAFRGLFLCLFRGHLGGSGTARVAARACFPCERDAWHMADVGLCCCAAGCLRCNFYVLGVLIFLKISFISFRRAGKGGREASMCGCLSCAPQPGTWPAAQACALTGN